MNKELIIKDKVLIKNGYFYNICLELKLNE